ncbi:hypothetical protein L0F63_003864, partial [Massospora cicadina]
RGVVPRNLDFGLAPCAAALEECRRVHNAISTNHQVGLLFKDLNDGNFAPDTNIYHTEYDSEDLSDEPP